MQIIKLTGFFHPRVYFHSRDMFPDHLLHRKIYLQQYWVKAALVFQASVEEAWRLVLQGLLVTFILFSSPFVLILQLSLSSFFESGR